ncbi:MAG: hypothetical protein KF833_18355 [Verrucomicrobiae bacterium]|nr:hypothetical protein [Verrucomicrobiae bacterium]
MSAPSFSTKHKGAMSASDPRDGRRRNWEVNRARLRWFGAGLAVLLVSGGWFCWLQPPLPVGLVRAGFPSWSWWWQPREEHAAMRLPRLPSARYNASFFIKRSGWVVGEAGLLVRTMDGGRSWTVPSEVTWEAPAGVEPEASAATEAYGEKAGDMPPNVEQRSLPAEQRGVRQPDAETPRGPRDLYAVHFADEQRGWVVGDGGVILRTEDGGATWRRQMSGTDADLRSVSTVDGTNGWAVGWDGIVLRTADGGATWGAQTSGIRERLLSVAFADGQRGWAVGEAGTILRTEDGGASWREQTSGTKEYLMSVAVADGQRAWAVGGGGTLLRTEDGGENWRVPTSGSGANEEFRSVAMADGTNGWAVGWGGTILRTEDGGATWRAQTSGTRERLVSAVVAEGRRGWAMGQGGTILRTEDGGATWWAQTAGPREDLESVALADGQRGWAVGRGGTILRTEDGGATWRAQAAGMVENLRSVALVDGRLGWAVGEAGTILRTEDGGASWRAQDSGTAVSLSSVSAGDGRRGWAVGSGGTILRTEDGGANWRAQDSGTVVDLPSVSALDALRGWAVESIGRILHTDDGGGSWRVQYAGVGQILRAVWMADGQRGWAVGEEGAILRTEDGGASWQGQSSGTLQTLHAAALVDGQRGWVVGNGGAILRTEDGGASWRKQNSGTVEDLRSVAVADGQRGLAVGRGGTILRTEDGGENWQRVEMGRYRRWPAPVFWVSLVAAAGLGWVGWRVPPTDASRRRTTAIEDFAASDRPLRAGEFDALNLGPLAEGIANFLRHEKTLGPLTFAVEGRWGSGKSSLMGLLRSRLERHGFRTVWFNAWHHESEAQVLAALLEAIRNEAVPAWMSWEGLRFRCRLIHRRLIRRWAMVLAGVGAVAALGAVVHTFGPDWRRWLEALEQSTAIILGGKLAVLAVGVAAAVKTLQGLRAFGVDPAKLMASMTNKARVSDLQAQTSLRHRFAEEFADVTEALQPKTMTVFIDDLDRCEPKQVMEVMRCLNFLASSGECFLILGMEEQVVTNCVALSLSDQFVMEDGLVVDNKGAMARHRRDYAKQWMEKLIQIRIPVPAADDAQLKALLRGPKEGGTLERKASVAEARDWPDLLRRWGAGGWERVKPVAPWVAAVLTASVCFGLVHGQLKSASERNRRQAEASAAALRDAGRPLATWPTQGVLQPQHLAGLALELAEPASGKALMTNEALTGWLSTQRWTVRMEFQPGTGLLAAPRLPETARDPANQGPVVRDPDRERDPAERVREWQVVPGLTDEGWKWYRVGLAVVLVLAAGVSAARLLDWLQERIEDSEDFRVALDDWHPEIARREPTPTPRAVKRLLNKLRFYSMLLRTLSGPRGRPVLSDRIIVAFGILEEEHDDLGSVRLTDPSEAQVADLAALQSALREHAGVFGFLQRSVRTGPPPGSRPGSPPTA